jgi:hypothetical protein
MSHNLIFNGLSKRSPTIVVATLCAALLLDWTDAALWLPYALAIVVGSLALVLMATRDRRGRQVMTANDADSTENDSWIAHELAGKGTPSGSYLLGFFALVTIVLTGVQGAYAMPAWAGLALGAAWGIANARYRPEERSDP